MLKFSSVIDKFRIDLMRFVTLVFSSDFMLLVDAWVSCHAQFNYFVQCFDYFAPTIRMFILLVRFADSAWEMQDGRIERWFDNSMGLLC